MVLCLPSEDGDVLPCHVDETGALQDGASDDGTVFQVRVRPAAWWDELDIRHTRDGRRDRAGYVQELWPGILAGWSGLVERVNGKPTEIPYSSEAAAAIGQRLPPALADALYLKARRPVILRDDALGN